MKSSSERRNSLEQENAGLNEKSVQEVSKQKTTDFNGRYAKSDVRYWERVIFKPTYTQNGRRREVKHFAAKIQHLGRRETFSFGEANQARAAARAKEIYLSLKSVGWDATLEKFKPEMQRKSVSTVGDLVNELREHWSGRAKTFQDYCRSFRTILSQMFQIEGGREKFDYVNGGRAAWIAKIDRIKLADVTPDKVNKWRIAFVKRAGANPVKQRRARITCNSLMRQAKSLFSPDLLAHVSLDKPDKLPFDGVAFYDGESMRYHSTVDVEALIQNAMRELPQEQLKVFLLAAMAGLRRNEIDKLQWTAFRWNDAVIRIEATEFFAPKTSEGEGDVPIDKELSALFRGWHAKATSTFVVEADAQPRAGTSYTHYRAQRHFDSLAEWLRAKRITSSKPLHELRKEFGSLLCQRYGIFAASRMLRHSRITTTAAHYLDQKERPTLGLGNLLTAPKNVVAIGAPSVAQKKRTSRMKN
jgi:integrase